MANYTFPVQSGSWISGYGGAYSGDNYWEGWTLANTSDASYVSHHNDMGQVSGSVSIVDDGAIPTTITAVGNTVVILRVRQAGDELALQALINNDSITSGSIIADANFTNREFTLAGPTSRAQIFSFNYGARGGSAPPGGSNLDWAGIGVKFNFTLAAPTAITGSASNIGPSSADLAGTINASGGTSQFSTSFYFEYGLTAAYGSVTSTTSGYTGSSDQGVTGSITSGLSANTTYHYRIVATNDDHTVVGSDQTFITTGGDPTVSFF